MNNHRIFESYLSNTTLINFHLFCISYIKSSKPFFATLISPTVVFFLPLFDWYNFFFSLLHHNVKNALKSFVSPLVPLYFNLFCYKYFVLSLDNYAHRSLVFFGIFLNSAANKNLLKHSSSWSYILLTHSNPVLHFV